MAAYYNEIEPYAAQWLRNLIKAGHIANGEVDTRSIVDVSPDDLRGFTQCHFFAGIGGWSHALRLAGWPDDRPIWTGSCPCQPFSVAGKGAGTDDPRHLWPHFHRLITACRPPVVMGEQVAAAVGKSWLDGVSSDLEGIGYATGAAVVPACAVNAPHRRDRLWFVADASCERRQQIAGSTYGDESPNERRSTKYNHISPSYGEGNVAHTNDHGRQTRGGDHSPAGHGHTAAPEGRAGHWDDHIWLTGSDGKSRRSQPGLPLLAYGVSNRVGRLRAYGNAIVPPLAAEVIKAFMMGDDKWM